MALEGIGHSMQTYEVPTRCKSSFRAILWNSNYCGVEGGRDIDKEMSDVRWH